ncbi:hypothetical protein HYH03_011177 [Edaphochlamys debaryana]|uniref:VOC domain-containing protein n=1 Tax=Edaphochlamys debaryana TaxID=47281 RepID=A0A836BVF0_9CHLO|nr:hypothetical protein HYH03_011177 [Edaphochlamys debaryana]|eukprot:KAG2490375.1 hypothetical protein HYH03_011177 [Edaphochlamys debaryana]
MSATAGTVEHAAAKGATAGSHAHSAPRLFPAVPEVGCVSAPAAAPTTPSGGPDPHCLDLGNVIALEHVNLEVPDLEVARLFYAEGLGLTADPGTTGQQRGGAHVVWYNCGRQQFHIARGPAPQRLPPGSVIGLVLPDVAGVAQRLEAVKQTLGDVSITYARGDTLEAVDPYGNTFSVHTSLPYFPGRAGVAYVQLPCFKGTAAAIASFYAQRMGARARVSEAGGSSGRSTTGGTMRAEVWLGPGSKLVFVEQPQLGAPTEEAVAALFDGWHVAIYVADFSRTYEAVHHPGRPPFNEHPYRDHYHSLSDAIHNRQFRFQDITAPLEKLPEGAEAYGGPAYGNEALVYRISHEVRALAHPLYGRPLYNREGGFA